MIEELARHGYKLSPGTLYPILHGLQEGGLLRSYEVCVKGKIRRIYRITAEGQRALTAAKEKVRELFGELFEHGAEYKQRRALAQVVSVPAALYRRRRTSRTTA
jgi:DNA-binding PadR family transcriptional regulator